MQPKFNLILEKLVKILHSHSSNLKQQKENQLNKPLPKFNLELETLKKIHNSQKFNLVKPRHQTEEKNDIYLSFYYF